MTILLTDPVVVVVGGTVFHRTRMDLQEEEQYIHVGDFPDLLLLVAPEAAEQDEEEAALAASEVAVDPL